MKTKLEILARLLKEDKITIDEFVILSEREVEIKYINQNFGISIPYINPLNPPYIVTC